MNAPGRDGNTPLHYAVAVNSKPVVEMLLHAGADPRKTNKVNAYVHW